MPKKNKQAAEDQAIDEESKTSNTEGDEQTQTEQVDEVPNEDQTDPQSEITKLDEQLKEAQGRLLKARADLDNQSRRHRELLLKQKEQNLKSLLEPLLPVFENLGRALDSDSSDSPLHQGVALTYQMFEQVLSDLNVSPMTIVPEESSFDAQLHEAMMQEASDEIPAGTIIRVLDPGYMLGHQVIKYAKVCVSQGPAEKAESE